MLREALAYKPFFVRYNIVRNTSKGILIFLSISSEPSGCVSVYRMLCILNDPFKAPITR